MKILFISAEVFPFAKRGGLADVVGSLPKELAKMGHDVRVVMPAYSPIEQAYANKTLEIEPLPVTMSVQVDGIQTEAGAFSGTLPNTDIPIYFIAHQELLGRPEIYGYQDDVYRFSFFSKASCLLYTSPSPRDLSTSRMPSSA